MNDSGTPPADDSAVLEAVGNETRVGIVKALADHRSGNPRDPGLSFSELRGEVGVRDSGRFNYHLDQLRGGFVEEVDGEYRLTYAGRKLATALLTGTYRGGHSQGPVEYGDCPRESCDARLVATCEDGIVRVECENDHTAFRSSLPPAAATERSMDELLALVTRRLYHDADLAAEGICPLCYGEMETALTGESRDAAVPYAFEAVCQRCGFDAGGAAGVRLLSHPEVMALFDDHDRDVREEYPWQLEFITAPESYTLLSEDPLRVRIDVALADEELRATVDETASVVETVCVGSEQSGN